MKTFKTLYWYKIAMRNESQDFFLIFLLFLLQFDVN